MLRKPGVLPGHPVDFAALYQTDRMEVASAMMVLEGIRVIDWTILQAGPVASEMLGDLGAEVIKIEQRGKGDRGRSTFTVWGVSARLPGDRTFYFENSNRNKKSVTLDLTKPKAKEVMRRLVEKSDVFVQNFRKGVAEKYQLDFEALRRINPKLIYAQGTGLGEEGPENGRPTLDMAGIFRTGFAQATTGPGDEPIYPAGGLCDQLNGWSLAYGILAALLAMERHGFGQKVTSSFLSSMSWLQGQALGAYLYKGELFPVLKRREATNPLVTFFRCADGKWLFIALNSDRYWPDFCRATELMDLLDDSRFANLSARCENHEALIDILDDVFARKTLAEWLEVLGEYRDFIYTTGQSIADLVKDPQMIANNCLLDFEHPTVGKIKMVAPPVSLSETPGGVRLPPPEFGQHTEEVLTEVCGYTREEMKKMREEEVI
ncbi:MAG: CoA transferase [Chloroflexi bacterium]|nr:CoA transferase [Chloroflexota bacterium]